jgi:hypothetical protein
MRPPRRLQRGAISDKCATAIVKHIPKNEMKGRLLLDVVITQRSTILQLLASENESLLIWGNAGSE